VATSLDDLLAPLRPHQDLATLAAIEKRVLWLACRMIDHANHDRPNTDGIKVGGHQASSASMTSLMTALYFAHLEPGDRVSVKPHASPVYHAITYLTGHLDRRYLTTLREKGGLQAYPSRTKDPDPIDFSTGSVGLGVAAPLFAATVRRYTDAHFGANGREPRFIALMGDAELDEGNVWEAIADPAVQGLGNVTWVVDLNRQSLDRVVPGIKSARLQKMFADNGWNVVEAKYGRILQAAFARPGGGSLRACIDEMPNEVYQSFFALKGAPLREAFYGRASNEVRRFLDQVPDESLATLIQNLGGHDLTELLSAYSAADAVTDRPTVVFAYTIKGYGLPMAGDPLNHAALMTKRQIEDFRDTLGLTEANEWDRFEADSPEQGLCDRASAAIAAKQKVLHSAWPTVPTETDVLAGVAGAKPSSTQETFGKILVNLARVPEVASRMVTTAPDVAVSTNLGGWINKVGVFTPEPLEDLRPGDLLRWIQGPSGQHIELGISEMNLFLLLGMLGLSSDLNGQPLLPIGTVYDPFVCRGLDAFIYAVYSGARFVVAGTPAGTTLSYEGGAHQSTITASIGVELPGVCFAEPAYGTALDWMLCDGLNRLGAADGEAMYLRLTTRPLDQAPFEAARSHMGTDELRRQVLAGGYRLVDASALSTGGAPVVTLVGSGAVLPETIAAAAALADEGVAAHVVDVTSLDRLYRLWRGGLRTGAASASRTRTDDHLAALFGGVDRHAPMITVHDASPHAMAWLGSIFGAPVTALGVDMFGQSASITDTYKLHGLDTDTIVNAALVALE
jgi:pyruvate dehydrogenase E1 component